MDTPVPDFPGKRTEREAARRAALARNGPRSLSMGVYRTQSGKFVARFEGKRLGTFSTPEEASAEHERAWAER